MLTASLRPVTCRHTPLSSTRRHALTTLGRALRLAFPTADAIGSTTTCRTTRLTSCLHARCLVTADNGIAFKILENAVASAKHPQRTFPTCLRCHSDSAAASNVASQTLEAAVPPASHRSRLDAFVSTRWPAVSRARWQEAIKEGLVAVNGKTQKKVAHTLRLGDMITAVQPPSHPLLPSSSLAAEDIPLAIVYEDDVIVVVNKEAHMVVHPAAGNWTGTLVNALLHHCHLPDMSNTLSRPSGAGATPETSRVVPLVSLSDEGGHAINGKGGSRDDDDDVEDDVDDDDWAMADEDEAEGYAGVEGGEGGDGGSGVSRVRPSRNLPSSQSLLEPALLRPGIVHRLDKGTSGLLVVAKDFHAMAHLSAQFKARTVSRTYLAIVSGCPASEQGRVNAAIGRDPAHRKRMAVMSASARYKTRHAASRYYLEQSLAGGGAALMRWKLETGRTHQIRVHSQHIGHPLLGDDTYGGSSRQVLPRLLSRLPARHHPAIRSSVQAIRRPMLHAQTLGFVHPVTGQHLMFEVPPPSDFQSCLGLLLESS